MVLQDDDDAPNLEPPKTNHVRQSLLKINERRESLISAIQGQKAADESVPNGVEEKPSEIVTKIAAELGGGLGLDAIVQEADYFDAYRELDPTGRGIVFKKELQKFFDDLAENAPDNRFSKLSFEFLFDKVESYVGINI